MYEKKYIIKIGTSEELIPVNSAQFMQYLEWCRYSFMQDKMGIDLDLMSSKGIIYHLVSCAIDVYHPLFHLDKIRVTCDFLEGEKENSFIFEQQIVMDGLICVNARIAFIRVEHSPLTKRTDMIFV
ncbi:acyl-CoA thioesterase [Vibrio caribbeanicus]|uniref:Uncharacterized protein n=1 Tax=Vibrio caribbeanicus ATCC BAA-2122 TaxID=796620 RepID=E3BQ03_9VIBR|nr:acyl-CoA thioesterase [Vibrio caribbeanicus]EFP94808.1 hypothetical protein VIBC2010_16709 [Vibrio caribbeanicus ATCC BAA-2122]